MMSYRQIEANRRNALLSTGPKTETGKKASRRNALRHGLTAETVVAELEDPEDYKAFQATVASDFDAQTAVERELVLRLASLLWRLRRAIAIDTGLIQIADVNNKISDLEPTVHLERGDLDRVVQFAGDSTRMVSASTSTCSSEYAPDEKGNYQKEESASQANLALASDLAARFLRLDSSVVERLTRYETALWHQTYQLIFVLDYLRRRNLDLKWAPRALPFSGRLHPLRSMFPKG